MSDERLKKIKDSIDIQMRLVEELGIDEGTKEVIEEEKELYDEVMRLRDVINNITKILTLETECFKALDILREEYEKRVN